MIKEPEKEPAELAADKLQMLFEKDRSIKKQKDYKQLTGYLIERKISQEEIDDRYEWIQSKRLQSNSEVKNRNCTVRQVRLSNTLHGLYCIKFSPNGETIVAAYGSGCIQLRNAETGELRSTIKSSLDTSFPVTCCRYHPIRKEIIYASSACGNIFTCKLDKIEFWKFAEEYDNEINTIDITLSGDCIVSGGKDGGFRIYDSETTKLIKNYKKDKCDLIIESAIKFHHMRIFAAKCHQAIPNIVITGGWDGVKIWDLRVGNGSIRSIIGPYICGDALDVHDTRVLTGSWVVRDSLQIWDLLSGKLLDTIRPVNRPVNLAGEFLYCARYFDGDPFREHVIVGGSATGNVEVVNLKEKSIVACYSTSKAVVTVDSYRNALVYGGMDSTVNLTEFT